MNPANKFLLAVAFAIGSFACGTASAHGHGGGPRFGIDFVVGPWWWGPPAYYYYPPEYYYPPVAAAPVYVTPSTAQIPAPPSYWYFCAQSNAYYPYVAQCPGGWQQVSPAPPQAPASPAR